MKKKKIRIVLAKAGLDGHDRGINIVKDTLIGEGYEVFYFGLYRDLDGIIEIAVQEGVDFIGLNIHSGAHMKYVEKVFERLKNHGALDIGLILGGIIPEKDEKILKEKFGVKKIFVSGTPEANLNEMKTFFRENSGRSATDVISLITKNQIGLALSVMTNDFSKSLVTVNEEIIEKLLRNKILTLGITGPLGVGKSSLIDKLIVEFRALNKKVGVITVDPSDHTTGGALLGRDRTQMWQHLYDPNVHIYSLATRGYQGGIAEKTAEAVEIMKIAGCDIVLVETIGVGQDQVEIKNIVDKVLLVLTPDIGEDQIYKSGIMQVVDYFVINKADIGDPSFIKEKINEMLNCKFLTYPFRSLVFTTTSNKEKENGVGEIIKHILNK